jgi:hypothetical protein
MKEIKKIEITLVEDRNLLKWRVNLVKDNLIFGCIKPID